MSRSILHSVRAIFVAVALFALFGCDDRSKTEIETLRVSAIPDQTPDKVLDQHRLLVEQICQAVAVPCEWVAVATYEDLVDRVGRGEIDLAYFGAASFAVAQHRHGAIPLAMRDSDEHFASVVVVRVDDVATALEDLRGRRFAFGAKASTSGHLMARHFMAQAGIEAERDFASVAYSGNHNETMRLVAEDEVDAGAVNGVIAERALQTDARLARQLRILWRSPLYIDYVWAARRDLPETLQTRLSDAFLDLRLTLPAHRAALQAEAAKGYVPAFSDDFEQISSVLRERGEL